MGAGPSETQARSCTARMHFELRKAAAPPFYFYCVPLHTPFLKVFRVPKEAPMDVKHLLKRLGVNNRKVEGKANEYVRLASLRLAGGGLGQVSRSR